MFERVVINVFKGLSWNYRSKSSCKFGKKSIVTGLVKFDRWGFGLNWGWQRARLLELERMVRLLDGKIVPDNRDDISLSLSLSLRVLIHENWQGSNYEDEMFIPSTFRRERHVSRSKGQGWWIKLMASLPIFIQEHWQQVNTDDGH